MRHILLTLAMMLAVCSQAKNVNITIYAKERLTKLYRNMKSKLFSLVIAILCAMNVLAATTEASTPSGISLTLQMPTGWTNPFIWTWPTSGNGQWEKLTSQSDGTYTYYTANSTLNFLIANFGESFTIETVDWRYSPEQTVDENLYEAGIYTYQINYNSFRSTFSQQSKKAWSENNVITYSATEKLPETNINYSNGLKVDAFNAAIVAHEFSNGKGKIIFDDKVTNIGDFAFANSKSLTSITIPKSVISIGARIFEDCSSLISIYVDSSNTHYCDIDGVLFNSAKDTLIQYARGNPRKEYIIPNGVKHVQTWALSRSTFTSIIFPESTKSIGDQAICYCDSLLYFVCYAKTPPTCSNDWFQKIKTSIPVYVPRESIDAYKANDGWKDLSNIQSLAQDFFVYQDCGKNGIDTALILSTNGHDYVDLGLSVYWATCNVGATSPESYGNHYAWGETEPKTSFSWANYKYSNESGRVMTKYNSTDGKTTLDLVDDAAHVNLGGAWRTPTEDEWKELTNNCITAWYSGYNLKITNKNNENAYIILPRAGVYTEYGTYDTGRGHYWTSTISTMKDSCARREGWDRSYWWLANDARMKGQSVRAVCPKTITSKEEVATLTLTAEDCSSTNTLVCAKGQQINIQAMPKDLNKFVRWSDGNTENPRLITVTQDSTFTAIFAPVFDPSHPLNPGKYNVSATASPTEGGTISGTGEYAQGATAQLTATANTGYSFLGWSDGEKNATRSFTMPAHDTAFVANFEINSYLITFNNYDGTQLQSSNVNYGTMPQYTGTTPEKPSTKHWSYTFKTWNPQLVAVTKAATYTATYDSTLIALDTVIVTDEQNISDLLVGDITHIIVRETGKLVVDETTSAASLTLYQSNVASAQVVGIKNLSVASADMVLRLEPTAEQATLAKWYAFGVPFEVEVASGIAKEGASSKAQSGYDFVIDNYDGALRATTQQGWKRCQTSDVLQQGKFYMIAVNGTQNLWRFTKKASAAITEQTSLTVNQNTATSANHSGWNGLSNSLLQSAMASMKGITYATIYRNATSTYETILLAQSALDASHPFFVQVAKSGTILLSEATTNAPARMLAATTIDDNPIYTIAFENKDYTDKAYLSLSETKANEYTIGLDVEKMQANTTSQPQLWLEAYGMQLAAHEATIAEHAITTIPVGLYAPADGEFTLTTTTTTTTTFALLNNGSKLTPTTTDEETNTASWTLYLTKGTNNNYALQIGQRGIGTSLNHYPLPTTHYTKFIQNGTLYIKRDGKMYNAQGGEVK